MSEALTEKQRGLFTPAAKTLNHSLKMSLDYSDTNLELNFSDGSNYVLSLIFDCSKPKVGVGV